MQIVPCSRPSCGVTGSGFDLIARHTLVLKVVDHRMADRIGDHVVRQAQNQPGLALPCLPAGYSIVRQLHPAGQDRLERIDHRHLWVALVGPHFGPRLKVEDATLPLLRRVKAHCCAWATATGDLDAEFPPDGPVVAGVTYVMLEGEAGLRNRVVAWESSYGTAISAQFYGMPQGFAFSEHNDVTDLAATLPKGGVVIVDTLNRAAPGKDENSSKDMGDVLAGMKLLQSLTEGLVLVVHHTGKDTSKALRGHSSLHAALDGAIEVRRTAASRSWSSAKVKDGADDFEVPFKLSIIHLGFDDDGDAVTSCVAVPDLEALFMPKRPSGKNQILAWDALRLTQQAAFTEE